MTKSKQFFQRAMRFINSEKGFTAESLAWSAVIGTGACTTAFGIYGATRSNFAAINADLQALQTSSSLPVAGETTSLQYGHTGAVTGIVIDQ